MLKTATLCVAVSSFVKYLRVRQFAFSAVLAIALAGPAFGEVGEASWYGGSEHHGRRTASGERFDQNALTCASRQYRRGKHLRFKVTNLRNGKSIVCRVNDFGPHVRTGRIIDVSHEGARRLGMVRSGVVKVRVERLR